MKRILAFWGIIVLLGSCGWSEREKALQEKEAQLNQMQQVLLLQEQELRQKEQLLQEREHRLDSTRREIDSVVIHGPSVAGNWQIKMQCVETNCPGSAIGDVKTEQWEFSTEGNNIIVKVFTGKKLIRIYNGNYTQSGMRLIDKNTVNNTAMEVTLRMLNEKKMDGIREIIPPNCKTIYSITAERL